MWSSLYYITDSTIHLFLLLCLLQNGALEGTLTQLFQYSNPNADNVTKKVCSLLSYYEMVKSIDDSEALNGSLRTILKQNLMDACAWVS